MNRRISGIIGAVVLAVVGTFVLVAYVQSARDQALADEALVDVWVVKAAVAEGVSADDIDASVARRRVPARLRVPSSVSDLDELEGMVTATELVPGEQLVKSRFVTPVEARQGDVPDDLLQVTVELAPQRAVGGRLRPGDTVGVLLSFAPFDLEGTIPDGSGGTEQLKGKTGNTTHLTFHKVLVTAVQSADTTGVPALAGEEGATDDPARVGSAPTGALLVTLALEAPAVEQVVFAAEYGSIWLSAEPPDAPEDGTRIVDRGNVYDRRILA